MTWLDLVVVLLVVLAAWGGYVQGAIRGVIRLLALLAIGLGSAVFVRTAADRSTARDVFIWSGLGFMLVTALVAALGWLALNVIPRRVQRHGLNRWLGIVPAAAQAVLVLSLLLALAARLAPADQTQHLIRDGLVTGPLILPYDWLEGAIIAQ